MQGHRVPAGNLKHPFCECTVQWCKSWHLQEIIGRAGIWKVWYCNCPSAMVLYSVLYSCMLKILEGTHMLRNTSTHVFNTFKRNQTTQCCKLCNCLRVCAGGKACSSFHSCIGSFALTIVCRRILTEKLFLLYGIYAPLSCWYRLSLQVLQVAGIRTVPKI